MNASWVHSSLAIRCLRRPLEAAGYEVVLIEGTAKDRSSHMLERLYAEQADLYGFSCYIWNLSDSLSLAETLKGILPSAKIVLGGPEVSFGTERFTALPFVDTVIAGEGEDAIVTVAETVKNGSPLPKLIHGGRPDVMHGEGILYRDTDETGNILYYESSRGCPYRCAYCLSSATEGVRMKSVGEVLHDLEAFETLRAEYKIVKFVDRTFNADVARANRIWESLKDDRFTGHYHFEVCASLLNEESFRILSELPKGKIQLEFGLQSTNPETLSASARHIDPEKVLQNVKRIHEMGNIHVHLDLIAGLPYEGYARFAESFDRAFGTCDLLQLGFLKLLYGTKLREEAETYGYVSLPNPPYTVLQSKWITFSEMQHLTHVAETLDRYLESGNFAHTFAYLNRVMPSPFGFFEGLTDFIASADSRPLQKISQPDAFRYLWEYAKAQSFVDSSYLKESLSVDFSSREHKLPPSFLRNA